MTGKQLFLNHAYNCACVRYGLKQMSEEDFEQLKSWRKNGTDPDVQVLGDRFPDATGALREYAAKMGREEEMWELEIVQAFWNERIRRIASKPTPV